MELTEVVKELLMETAQTLQGSTLRIFVARMVCG